MRSLQSRLTLGLILSLLVLFVGQWVVVDRMVRSVVEGYAQSRIDHDMETLLAAITFNADGVPSLDAPSISAVYNQPLSGHYYQLRAGGELLRSRSLWDTPLPDAPIEPGARRRFHLHDFNGQILTGSTRGFEKQGHPFTLTVAEDLSTLREEHQRFRLTFSAFFLVAIALLIAIQRLVVRTGLAPLERARRDLARLERGEIEALDERAPPEVRPLVGEINRRVSQMRRRLDRSRNALGNLAHALKAPLTLLTQSSDEAPEPLRAELHRHTEALRELMERELKRARLAAGGDGPRLALRAEVEPLVETLRRIHGENAPRCELRIAEQARFAMDREDLLELLGNLLDNAYKWADGRVRLTIECGRGLTLSIEDDGPGVPEERLAALTRRGTRLDESTEGHGLGLAIVRDLVEDYGGHMTLDRSPELGGLRAEIQLHSAIGAAPPPTTR